MRIRVFAAFSLLAGALALGPAIVTADHSAPGPAAGSVAAKYRGNSVNPSRKPAPVQNNTAADNNNNNNNQTGSATGRYWA